MSSPLTISWFGRCCFLLEINNIKVLFDPYDTFCNVDIGSIDAQILISSSTWHDHGHIGASPGAWIFTYPGEYNHMGLKITGIETEEVRGTPTVIFNIVFENYSVTNFADMGVYDRSRFSKDELQILKSTNIAFIRSGHERVLDFCKPAIIIPEHYFPIDFVQPQVPEGLRKKFEIPNNNVDEMIKILGLPVVEIDDFEYDVDFKPNHKPTIVRLMKIHPQVKYSQKTDFKKYW